MCRKSSIAIALLVILTAFQALIVIVPSGAIATTRYVGGAGPGNYTNIQDAIDNASSGDTIFVYSGVYNERLSIGKSISLIGQDRDSTIIDGNRSEDVVRIETSWVNFSGFTVRNSGRLMGIPTYIANSGLKLKNAENCTVTDNNFTDNFVSLYLYYNSHYNNVFGNIVYDNVAWGIGLYKATWNTITENIVMWSNTAIRVESSNNNTFTNNLIIKNPSRGVWLYNSVWNFFDWNNVWEDFGAGFYLWGGGYNVISNNTINSNDGDGIRLWTTYCNIFMYNQIRGNLNNSLTVTDSRFNIVTENTLSHSGKTGAHLVDSKDNLIFHNNFDSNPTQARDNIIEFMGSNSWDSGYPSGGNYWSDYSGSDALSGPNQDQPGSDGIGDSRYPVIGGDSEDFYPLMERIGYPPSEPRNLKATAGKGEVALTWEPPQSDGNFPITKYRIYRGTESGTETFETEVGNTQSYTDEGLTNGQTYYYMVSAVNEKGESQLSNEANATPYSRPDCTILSPVTGETISETYTIEGISSDSDGEVQKAEIRFDDGIWIEATGSTSWTYDWDTTTVGDGEHKISARSFDGSYYSAVVSVTVTVENRPEALAEEDYDWSLVGIIAAEVVLIVVLLVILLLLMRKIRRKDSKALQSDQEEGDVQIQSEE